MVLISTKICFVFAVFLLWIKFLDNIWRLIRHLQHFCNLNHSTFMIMCLNKLSQKCKCIFKLYMDLIVMKICFMSLKLNANMNVISLVMNMSDETITISYLWLCVFMKIIFHRCDRNFKLNTNISFMII